MHMKGLINLLFTDFWFIVMYHLHLSSCYYDDVAGKKTVIEKDTKRWI